MRRNRILAHLQESDLRALVALAHNELNQKFANGVALRIGRTRRALSPRGADGEENVPAVGPAIGDGRGHQR